MKKLLEVRRIGLAETNSSSSHSVIINSIDRKFDLKSLLPDENNIVRIPYLRVDFGNTNFQAFNNPVIKIQLVLSILGQFSEDLIDFGKKIFRLKRILCDFSGANDFIFEGLEHLVKNYNDTRKEGYEDSFYEVLDCTLSLVDHQSSRGLKINIFENKESVLNFIFNEDSWLFLSSDCCDNETLILNVLRKHYSLDSDIKNYATVELGYNIGNVDFPLTHYPLFSTIGDDIKNGRDYLLSYLAVFDPKTQSYVIDSNSEDDNLLRYGSSYFFDRGVDDFKIIFIKGDYWIFLKNSDFLKKLNSYYYASIDNKKYQSTRNCDYIQYGKILEDFLKTSDGMLFKEGEDWLLRRIIFNLGEYDI